MRRDYMAELAGKKPVMNSRKVIKSGMNEARKEMVEKAITDAIHSLERAVSLVGYGGQFANDIDDRISQLKQDIINFDDDYTQDLKYSQERGPVTNSRKAIKSEYTLMDVPDNYS